MPVKRDLCGSYCIQQNAQMPWMKKTGIGLPMIQEEHIEGYSQLPCIATELKFEADKT